MRALRLLALWACVPLALAGCGPFDPDDPDSTVLPEELNRRPAPAPQPDPDPEPSPEPAPAPAPEPAPEPAQPAPEDPLSALPTCPLPAADAFTREAMQLPAAGSGAYEVPSDGRLWAVESSVRAVLQGDAASGLAWATSAEYLLCRGGANEPDVVLWRPPVGSGQAVFAVRTGAARPAIFEAPHPLFDSGTLEQSRYLFERLNARALIASGTHRCASSEAAGCSGTTAACGSTAPFRISDMAHTEQSAFHAAHRAISEHFSQDWVLSIHGMGATGVSVSDGTSFATDAQSPSARVASALAASFANVTTCNAFDGVPYQRRLCGTTNAQGRHVNGSASACTADPQASSRRFIHLEQAKDVRGAHVTMGDVLDAVIP